MPQIFTFKEKEELRTKMLEAGFELVKEHGMTHTSVEKITKTVNIGRSTFYNFFPTKEKFIYDIIEHQRKKGREKFVEILAGRSKMTTKEAKKYFKYLLSGKDTIYQYLTIKDELKLQTALPEEFAIDPNNEIDTLNELFCHMEGVKDELDYEMIANIMKIIALTQESKQILHTNAINKTLDAIFELLYSSIFA